jgi:hypothetical protein
MDEYIKSVGPPTIITWVGLLAEENVEWGTKESVKPQNTGTESGIP